MQRPPAANRAHLIAFLDRNSIVYGISTPRIVKASVPVSLLGRLSELPGISLVDLPVPPILHS